MKDYLYSLVEKYSKFEFINTDPIQFCYRYTNPKKIEFVGIISALFSYGNVNSICRFLENLLKNLEDFPLQILDLKKEALKFYRFQTNQDVFEFVTTLCVLWNRYQTLEPYFVTSENLNLGILNFQREFWKVYNQNFFKAPSLGLKFLIGTCNPKSANKRLWMFLRWMTRNKFPDFGIYKTLEPKDLIYPLDTHILQFAKEYNISNRKTADYKKAMEITSWFAKYSLDDPLIFDFPISRMGILKNNKFR